jgi:hypothetical protein
MDRKGTVKKAFLSLEWALSSLSVSGRSFDCLSEKEEHLKRKHTACVLIIFP